MKQKYLILKETLEQTEQAERGPNKEAFEKKANGQRELGWGPNKENFDKKFHKHRELGG